MVLYLLSFVISPMKIGKRNLRMADVSPRIAAEGRFVRRPLPAMSEEKHLPFANDGNVAWNLAPHWGKKEKKRGEIGKISVREANQWRCSGEGERERGVLAPKPRSGSVSQVLCHVQQRSSEEVVTKLKDGG